MRAVVALLLLVPTFTGCVGDVEKDGVVEEEGESPGAPAAECNRDCAQVCKWKVAACHYLKGGCWIEGGCINDADECPMQCGGHCGNLQSDGTCL